MALAEIASRLHWWIVTISGPIAEMQSREGEFHSCEGACMYDHVLGAPPEQDKTRADRPNRHLMSKSLATRHCGPELVIATGSDPNAVPSPTLHAMM